MALNSKNNLEDVLAVLENNPDMVLKKYDFISITANWQDKPTNLRQIVEELNIGMDTVAFFDDSEYERESMRRGCPQVLVPELRDDSAEWVRILEGFDLFASEILTREATIRNQLYGAAGLRRRQAERMPAEEYYWHSKISLTIRHDEDARQDTLRITEIIQRTNQFNLTALRYNEKEISQLFSACPGEYRIFVMEYSDSSGISSVDGVALLSKGVNYDWIISVFCLTCRLRDRHDTQMRVAQALLAHIGDILKEEGAVNLLGLYVRTERNALVEVLYENLGFQAIDCDLEEAGRLGIAAADPEPSFWALDLRQKTIPFPEYIAIAEASQLESEDTEGVAWHSQAREFFSRFGMQIIFHQEKELNKGFVGILGHHFPCTHDLSTILYKEGNCIHACYGLNLEDIWAGLLARAEEENISLQMSEAIRQRLSEYVEETGEVPVYYARIEKITYETTGSVHEGIDTTFTILRIRSELIPFELSRKPYLVVVLEHIQADDYFGDFLSDKTTTIIFKDGSREIIRRVSGEEDYSWLPFSPRTAFKESSAPLPIGQDEEIETPPIISDVSSEEGEK